jgi:hypothetical protein
MIDNSRMYKANKKRRKKMEEYQKTKHKTH